MEERIKGIFSQLGFSDGRIEQLRLAKKTYIGPSYRPAYLYRPEEPPSYAYGFKINKDSFASDSTLKLEKDNVKSKDGVTRDQLFSKLDNLEHALELDNIVSEQKEQHVKKDKIVNSLQVSGIDSENNRGNHSTNLQADQLLNETVLHSNTKVLHWFQSNREKKRITDMYNKKGAQDRRIWPVISESSQIHIGTIEDRIHQNLHGKQLSKYDSKSFSNVARSIEGAANGGRSGKHHVQRFQSRRGLLGCPMPQEATSTATTAHGKRYCGGETTFSRSPEKKR